MIPKIVSAGLPTDKSPAGVRGKPVRERQFKALLFDADGTLYDSTMLHFEAYQKVSRELYNFDFTKEMYFDKVVAGYKKPPQVLREFGVPCKDEDFSAKKRGYYFEIAKRKLTPTAGLLALLQSAHDHGIPCCIVSGASRNSLEDSLKILQIDQYFVFRISYDDTLGRQKPAPFPYQIAVRKLGIPAGDCCAFEDTKSGIASARAAGVFCVGIRNAATLLEELEDSDLIAGDFKALRYECSKGTIRVLMAN